MKTLTATVITAVSTSIVHAREWLFESLFESYNRIKKNMFVGHKFTRLSIMFIPNYSIFLWTSYLLNQIVVFILIERRSSSGRPRSEAIG